MAAMGYLIWYFSIARNMLENWAGENGYQIIEHKFSNWAESGFPMSRSSVIYHVKVVDGGGNEKKGWVRCGCPPWGVFTNEIQVKWEN